MTFAIVIACHGDPAWMELAWSRAYPSALDQGARTIDVVYLPDGTVAEARNQGVARAEAEWVVLLDADDELAPGYLDAMDDAVRATTGLVLFAPALQYVREGVADPPFQPGLGRWPDLNMCCIGTAIRRGFFLNLGGFRELPSLEDYDLALRAVRAGAMIVPVPAAVYRAHVRPGSRNSDQSVYDQLRAEHADVWATRPG